MRTACGVALFLAAWVAGPARADEKSPSPPQFLSLAEARALAAVHARYRTPALAIWVLAAWSVLLVLGVAVLTETGRLDPAKSHFDRLTDFAMFGAVIFETTAVLSIFVFRRRYPDAERPYRCWGYPVVPALYAVLPAFILVNMFREQPAEALAGLGFIALGAGSYFLFGLGKTRPAPFVGVGEVRLDASPLPGGPGAAPEGIQRKDQVSG